MLFVFGLMVTQKSNPNFHSSRRYAATLSVKDRTHALRCLHMICCHWYFKHVAFLFCRNLFSKYVHPSPVETARTNCLKLAGGIVTRDNQKALKGTLQIGMVKGIIWVLHAAWQFSPTKESSRLSYSNQFVDDYHYQLGFACEIPATMKLSNGRFV